MIKNIIGAAVGAQLAKNSPKVDTTHAAAGGAVAASVIPFVLARLSLPLLVGVGAVAYLVNRRPRTTERSGGEHTALQSHDDSTYRPPLETARPATVIDNAATQI